jgi:hypothetical protein
MKSIGYQLLLAIFILIPVSVGAETIYLKDGSTITGKIKNVGTDEVVITTVIGEITIESAKILRVDRGTDTSPLTEKQAESSSPINVDRVEDVSKKSYSDWHMQQKNGFGFGPGISTMPGIILFYDRNLSGKSQLHVQLDVNAMSHSNIAGEEILKTQRSMLLTTYRYFLANSGVYLGAGGGYANSQLEYNSSTLFGSTPYQYTAKLNGVFLLGEVGWQGKDGYYFHVGLQPAAYISSSDNYDVNNIPDTSNHRDVANKEHDNLKQLSQLSIGFGWFF